jgi:hypothetical protein
MVFLIVIQAAVLFNANMVVHYSAFCGARQAVVEVPRSMIGEEIHNWVYPPEVAPSKKIENIRLAVVRALIPVSAALDTGDTNTFGKVFQQKTQAVFDQVGIQAPGWINRVRVQYDYADAYTQVELAKPGHWTDGDPDPDCPYAFQHNTGQWGTQGTYITEPWCPGYHHIPTMMWDFWFWEDLHVRVKYQFLLEVPYASKFLADNEVEIPGKKGTQYATTIITTVALTNEGGPEIHPSDYMPEP